MRLPYEILDKIIDRSIAPLAVVPVHWTNTPAYSAGSKLQDATAPSKEGYTFLTWITVSSRNWVGAPYFEFPNVPTSAIFTPTAKPTTSGTSLTGYALMIKSEMIG